MHPLTPKITRAEDQTSSSSTFATPLSQYPTRTLLSAARAPISSLPSTYLQTCHCDFETERQRHLRQNQDIIRLVALKSIQIRRSEAEMSQLERTNLELTVALHRAQKELQEKSTTNLAHRHNLVYSSMTTSLQEEWAQLGQAQHAIPYLQRQVDSGLPEHHQQINQDVTDRGQDNASDADLMLSLTPRSKRRKLEPLAVSSAIPRDLAMLKLDHIRAIYQHEQNALVEMIRSHRSTTELYTQTLRILSEDRVCSNNSIRIISSRSSHPGQIHPREDHWGTCDQGIDLPLGLSHFFTEAAPLPPDRPARPSAALAVTPSYRKRAHAQQTPSPLPFFTMNTVPTKGDLANEMLNHSRPPEVDLAEGPVKLPLTSGVTTSSVTRAGSERQGLISGYNRISSTELALQTSNYPCEPARRLRRPVSRFQATPLPVLSEHMADTLYDITDASVPASPRSILSFDVPQPVPRRLVDSQDLIVENQKPRPAPATLRTPKRQPKTSPYRRQADSTAVKVSPSVAAKRDRYAHERAKARVQSKNLVAKFSNMNTGAQTSKSSEPSLTATIKGKDTVIEQDIKTMADDMPINTVKDAIELVSQIPPPNKSTTDASGKSTIRSPSRIPCAIPQQHRPGSSSSLVGRRSGLHHAKLKSLTAGQLLRRMNKSLLGTSRPPVLTRTIVQKAVSTSIHLALRKPVTEGVSSTVTAEPLTSAPCTALSSPAVTPTSTITIESTADAVEDQATPPVATVTKMRTATKPSVKSTVPIKSRRVTRSVLADRFRRVTRSTTAAASYML